MVADRVLAVLLTAGAQLQIWLGSDGTGHRLEAALLAAAIMAPVAVRRRYPAVVGTGVPVLAAVDHALWDPQFLGYPVATFCALYALSVWTPPRRFAGGTVLAAVAFVATSLAPGGGCRSRCRSLSSPWW